MTTQESSSSHPRHVAIIMDGNGRWAKAQGLARIEGHRKGAKTALDIMRYAGELKIPYLTLYAFSSENWGRPEEEVNGLMGILYQYLTEDSNSLIENQVSLHTIGRLERLPAYVRQALDDLRRRTQKFDRLHLTLALSYGARDEITRATQQIAAEVRSGQLAIDAISEDVVAQHLDTAGIPDPDLFIRTSGEMRLSNFLLWQLSYAELYVTDEHWPGFSRQHFDEALRDYAKRQRRFGKV